MTTHKPPPNPDVVVSTSAAVGGFASVFAWAACCVLPLALSLAGVSFAGAAVIAGARTWVTAIAAAFWSWAGSCTGGGSESAEVT